jgi:hypothetical protein
MSLNCLHQKNHRMGDIQSGCWIGSQVNKPGSRTTGGEGACGGAAMNQCRQSDDMTPSDLTILRSIPRIAGGRNGQGA